MSRDTIYREQAAAIKAFEFDTAVTAVFSDMIRRSVPGYRDTLAGIHRLASTELPEHCRCYDLGCSLGAATLSICLGLDNRAGHIIAVDNAAAMIDGCRSADHFVERPQTIDFLCADIADVEITNADLVVLNYTLQFLPPAERDALLRRIFEGLRPGGMLVLSEKFRFDDDRVQSLLTDQHHEFKRQNDYSDLEIAGKRSALENVLIADTRETHETRLRDAGFAHVVLWQANLNFGSFLAIRDDR
ncbi:MAG: carboxy-S-adenosyl-L-methionine synthase CmoA [Pseudomonadota bacterium]